MDSRQKIKEANDRRLRKIAAVEAEIQKQRIRRLKQEVTKLEGMLAECQESHTEARTGPKSPAG